MPVAGYDPLTFGLAPDALGEKVSPEQMREYIRDEYAWMGDHEKNVLRDRLRANAQFCVDYGAAQQILGPGFRPGETDEEYERRAHRETAAEYAHWQIQAAQTLRRCWNLDAVHHPEFGAATRVTRAADLAPYETPPPNMADVNLAEMLTRAQIEDLRSSSSEEELREKVAWMEFGQRQLLVQHFRRYNLLQNDILPVDAHLFAADDQAFGIAPYPLAVTNHRPLTFAQVPITKQPAAHRWGPQGRFDFWTARQYGLVEDPELRAVELLATICDEYRARQYLHTGLMPAIGNRTGRTYIVRRDWAGVKEIVDGKIKYSWCIHANEHMPPTDQVLALKNLIEGEEVEFRKTGNRREVLGGEKHIVTGLVHQDAI